MAKRNRKKRSKSKRHPTTTKGMAAHLRQQSMRGERFIGHPTPERAMKANGALRQGGDDSALGGDNVWRVEPVLEQLCNPKRPRLLPHDPTLCQILLSAGKRYRSHHHQSSIDPLKAVDLTSSGGGGFGPKTPTMYGADQKIQALEKYQAARAQLDPWVRGLLESIVIKDMSVEDVSHEFTFYRAHKLRIAVTLEKLTSALIQLAVHFELATAEAFCVHDKRPRFAHGAPALIG